MTIKKIISAVLGIGSLVFIKLVWHWKKTGKISKYFAILLTLLLSIFGAVNLFVVPEEKISFAAVEFYDTFTVASDTDLSAHTPDTGTGWTVLLDTTGGSDELEIKASEDYLTNGGVGLNDGVLYQTDDTMSSANYEVSVTMINGDVGDDTSSMCCRIQDANNMYCVRFNESDADLYKRVAGSWSTIDTQDEGLDDGSVATLKCIGTTISFEDDGLELLSASDNSHSGAGKAGLGMGEVMEPSDDGSAQELDNFEVDITGAPPPPTRRIIITE